MRTAKMVMIVWWGFVTCAAQADLTLPFEGASDTWNAAFKITNTNTLLGGIVHGDPQCAGLFSALGHWGIAVVGHAQYGSDPRRERGTRNYGGHFVAKGENGIGVYGAAPWVIINGNDGMSAAAAFDEIVIPNLHEEGQFGGYFRGGLGTGVFAGGQTGLWAEGSARGVEAYSSNLRGQAVAGHASSDNSTTQNFGGYFTANGGKGIAVYGRALKTGSVANYGGYFKAEGQSGRGVVGWGVGYDFYAAGPGTNYGVGSSIRWKTDIRPIDEPLEKVLNLRGVYFNWDAEHGGEHDMGMIAEEVGDVLPEVVQYEDDGLFTSGMDYSKIVPLLVEAIKELNADNQSLRRRLEALEGSLEQD